MLSKKLKYLGMLKLISFCHIKYGKIPLGFIKEQETAK